MTNEEILNLVKAEICSKLENPESATFPIDTISVNGDDENGYQVKGWVDSRNIYNAWVGNAFVATVTFVDGTPKVEASFAKKEENVNTTSESYSGLGDWFSTMFARDKDSGGFKEYSYTKKVGICIAIAVCIAIFGLLFLADYQTFEFGIFLESLAGAIFTLAIDYLIAKEFEFIAIEKGYEGRRYFWYSFILGLLGYLMVIALPYKKKD
ncbi:MAG: hypothetical protein IKU43_06915 [Clostridia bacterium]|nr:hypothetical protein [Clostridia bacterium]